ncbi:hypothetical protein BN946_scf184868.g11 [Trametes cinnabarina]|uniref:Uncharacterized protein n=1 Tax=Pycnoporus cinnabarinus TaxID=5643 RepID=A0A060SPW9_PYCCI|nr:hypothetical protein BN946_scf184868.g11 [Trametes cinnabarina]
MRQLLRSYIAALYIETVLFGAFTVTYAMGIWSLMRIDCPGKPSMRDRAIAIISTAMWVLALAMASNGFVDHAGSLSSVYDSLSLQALWYDSALGSARFAIYVTQTLIGDAFMIFRVFIVWSGSTKVIALPALLVVIDAGYTSVWIGFATFMPLVFFFFSFTTNVLCSSLIMWRTLRSAYGSAAPKLMSRRFTLKHRKVVEAILQSAAIYSAASVVLVITYFISSSVAYSACLGTFPSLIGLVFSFIVLRLAKRSRENAAPVVQGQYLHDAPTTLPVTREAPRTPTSPTFSIAFPSLAREVHSDSGDLESTAGPPEMARAADKPHIAIVTGTFA